MQNQSVGQFGFYRILGLSHDLVHSRLDFCRRDCTKGLQSQIRPDMSVTHASCYLRMCATTAKTNRTRVAAGVSRSTLRSSANWVCACAPKQACCERFAALWETLTSQAQSPTQCAHSSPATDRSPGVGSRGHRSFTASIAIRSPQRRQYHNLQAPSCLLFTGRNVSQVFE